MPVLAVNVDHVATVRQARLGLSPDPIKAALLAEEAGAAGIIAHLREDRRHIQDRDIAALRASLKTRLLLEMAATEEMQAIALKTMPYLVCLVPEKRQELTTEGGLAVAGNVEYLKRYLEPLQAAGIKSSLFIEAAGEQIKAARDIGVHYVELHTGTYADAQDASTRERELHKLIKGVALARELGLLVNLGHGLDYENVRAFAAVPGISDYSIGHSIISRALFTGIGPAVRDMADIVRGFTA